MVRAGVCVLVVAAAGLAQAPPAPAPQPERRQMDPELWQHLQRWEGVMKGAANFVSEKGSKTVRDEGKKTERVYDATIWCMKPNLARMRLERKVPAGQQPDPGDFTTYICNGKSVFEYEGGSKTVTEYPLGPAGGTADNLLLEFMSGSITALDAAKRFAIDWPRKDDPNYLILDLYPVRPEDKEEFNKLTLVLIKPGLAAPLDRLAYLPRLAKIHKPNDQVTETWDFPTPMVNARQGNGDPIAAKDFAFIPVPGWKTAKAAPKQPGRPQPPGKR